MYWKPPVKGGGVKRIVVANETIWKGDFADFGINACVCCFDIDPCR